MARSRPHQVVAEQHSGASGDIDLVISKLTTKTVRFQNRTNDLVSAIETGSCLDAAQPLGLNKVSMHLSLAFKEAVPSWEEGVYPSSQLVLEMLYLLRSITNETAEQYQCLPCRLSRRSTCLRVPPALAAVKTVTHNRPLKLVPGVLITMHALAGETRRRRGRDRGRDTDAKEKPPRPCRQRSHLPPQKFKTCVDREGVSRQVGMQEASVLPYTHSLVVFRQRNGGPRQPSARKRHTSFC